jgi:nucleoside-triphosphatase THEP1
MIIITGDVQSGKSTLAMELAIHLMQKKQKIAGIIAKGLWKDNVRSGFNLIDLSTNQQAPLARRKKDLKKGHVTPFDFFKAGMDFGANALEKKKCCNSNIILVDEVGKLELRGLGWACFLNPLLTIKSATPIWIVRENLVNDVCINWNLNNVQIVRVNEKNALERLIALCLNLSP